MLTVLRVVEYIDEHGFYSAHKEVAVKKKGAVTVKIEQVDKGSEDDTEVRQSLTLSRMRQHARILTESQ